LEFLKNGFKRWSQKAGIKTSRNKNILKIAEGKKGTSWKRIYLYCPTPACDCIVKDPVKLGDGENENKQV
jgi:hypothetical protein